MSVPDLTSRRTCDAPAECSSVAVAAEIPQAPFFGDPRFQRYFRTAELALSVARDLTRILDGGRYAVRDEQTLENVHEDAFLLYDVVNGSRPITDLLEAFERLASPDVFAAMLVDLHKFLQPRLVALTLALPPESEKTQ